MSAQRKAPAPDFAVSAGALEQPRFLRRIAMGNLNHLSLQIKPVSGESQTHTSACEPMERAAQAFARRYRLPRHKARLIVELAGIVRGGRHA